MKRTNSPHVCDNQRKYRKAGRGSVHTSHLMCPQLSHSPVLVLGGGRGALCGGAESSLRCLRPVWENPERCAQV